MKIKPSAIQATAVQTPLYSFSNASPYWPLVIALLGNTEEHTATDKKIMWWFY